MVDGTMGDDDFVGAALRWLEPSLTEEELSAVGLYRGACSSRRAESGSRSPEKRRLPGSGGRKQQPWQREMEKQHSPWTTM